MSLSLPESERLSAPLTAPGSSAVHDQNDEAVPVPTSATELESTVIKRRFSRRTWLALASVLVHIPVYGGFRLMAGYAPPLGERADHGAGTVHIRLIDTPAKAPIQPIPEDAQIVDTPAQEHIENAKPVETKLLSDKTTRTDKETVSEVAARATTPRKASSPSPATPKSPSVAQSPNSKSPDPTSSPKPSDKIELAAGGVKLPESPRGKFPKSLMEKTGSGGTGTGLLLPSTSKASAEANLQALDAGDLTSTDHLPDVERGRQTVLNANQYRGADFFLRVKQQVEKHWRPSEVYLRRDPTGQAYGVKDRYTVLRAQIDKSGKIIEIVTSRQSGLDFMDEEAKRAFRAAGPFLNPPAEIFDPDGRLRFEFGFYFEITGGKYRFQWRRL